VKTFPGKSMTSERFGNIDLLSIKRYELKTDLDGFVDEYDSRHANGKFKLH